MFEFAKRIKDSLLTQIKYVVPKLFYGAILSISAFIIADIYAFAFLISLSPIFTAYYLAKTYFEIAILIYIGLVFYGEINRDGFFDILKTTAAIFLYLPLVVADMIFNNAKTLTILLANRFLSLFKLTPIPYTSPVPTEEKTALKLENDEYAQTKAINAVYDACDAMLDNNEIKPGMSEAAQESYKAAEKIFATKMLDEYEIYLRKQTIAPDELHCPVDPKFMNNLEEWYLMYTRRRTTTWSFSKAFALQRIHDDTDDAVAGLSKEQITKLENDNPQWLCSITSGLMRNPVYVIISTGERRYFELLNLENWMSRAIDNTDNLAELPENREKIEKVYFDLELHQKIKEAISFERQATQSQSMRATVPNSPSLFTKIQNSVVYMKSVFMMFIDIKNADEEFLELQRTQSKNKESPNLKRIPKWQQIFGIWKATYTPESSDETECMYDKEAKAAIRIFDNFGYVDDGAEIIPLFRMLQANRPRSIIITLTDARGNIISREYPHTYEILSVPQQLRPQFFVLPNRFR